MARCVRTKGDCCRSDPRCKRCPVVWKRLAAAGYAERESRRRYRVVEAIPAKALKTARR